MEMSSRSMRKKEKNDQSQHRYVSAWLLFFLDSEGRADFSSVADAVLPETKPPSRTSIHFSALKRAHKQRVIPELREEDLEESFVRGMSPHLSCCLLLTRSIGSGPVWYSKPRSSYSDIYVTFSAAGWSISQ